MASIKYFVRGKKSPLTGEVKFYATSAPQELVSEEELIEQITQKTTVNRADVLAVLSALREEIRFNLVNGRKVKLDDIGTFRTSIKSKGEATKEAVTMGNIRSCRVVFTPSRAIMYAIKPNSRGVSFSNPEGKSEAAPAPKPEMGGGDHDANPETGKGGSEI